MVLSAMTVVGGTKILLWTAALVFTNLFTAVIFTITNQATYTGTLCPEYSGIQRPNSLHYDFDRIYDSYDQPFISNGNNKDANNDDNSLAISKREANSSARLKQHELPWLNVSSSIKVVQANCTILKKDDGCRAGQFEALVNLADRSTCKCEPGNFNTQVDSCLQKLEYDKQIEKAKKQLEQVESESDLPTIFAITPTYARTTQKVDLTSLCQTVKLIPNFVWIIIEDSEDKTSLVTNLLERCGVESVHLNVRTPVKMRPRPGQEKNPSAYSRGVEQRNAGLSWIKGHCAEVGCRGVIYFMDDDNKYDLRLFEQMRQTVGVSVFPVGFSGGLKFEGPICINGTAAKWHVAWDPKRPFPIDMAGFAINVDKVMEKPSVRVGFQENGKPTKRGYLETSFLENFATRETAECRGVTNEILVWHVKTQKPLIVYEGKHPSNPLYEL